jgi:ABC-2 type transport system ATP-binding protein
VASKEGDAPPILQLSGLRRRFGSTEAVRGLDLEIGENEAFLLLGANGAGKSTTIRMVCGLLAPTAGHVLIDGKPLRKHKRTPVGYCPQANVFYPQLSVLENLRFAGALFGVRGGIRRWRAERLAIEVGLGDVARRRAGRLSGGMQRRLTLATALMHGPRLLVVEEPESGLDPHAKQQVASILAAAKDERAVLMTSHDMVSAERLADRVGILEDGILMAVGTPAQLRSKYKPRDWSVRQHRATIGLEDLFLAMTGRGSVAL